jgi:hypothetical protein
MATIARMARPSWSGRDSFVDAVRGLCFVFMTLDHFPGNPLRRFSNPNFGLFGFFTAALGFVFLSGLISGRVYERSRVTAGFRSMTARVLRRVRAIYATQVLLYAALALGVALALPGADRWSLDAFQHDPLRGALLSFSLLYEPGYLGILPMYCLFLLATPLLLWQFDRGRAWVVLAGSAALWLAAGLLIALPSNPDGIDFGAFDPFSYQILFVVGLALGAGHVSIDRVPPRVVHGLFAAALAAAVIFFLVRLQYAFGGPASPIVDRLGEAFSIMQLGPLRLLNFAVFGFVVYVAARRVRWGSVQASGFRWLAFVGRHPLPVFGWSILVTYAAVAILSGGTSWPVGLLGALVAVASLTIPAALHAAVQRRRIHAAPAAPIPAPPAARRVAA